MKNGGDARYKIGCKKNKGSLQTSVSKPMKLKKLKKRNMHLIVDILHPNTFKKINTKLEHKTQNFFQ